jgi:hypothetical protein
MSFQNYFIYKGMAYGIGTKVKIVSSAPFFIIGAIGTKMENLDEVKNQIYTFDSGTTDGEFFFRWNEIEDQLDMKYGIRSQVQLKNLDNEILEVVEPVYVRLVSWQENAINNMFNKEVAADVFGGVLIYIVIMCIGAIFKDRLVIWLVSTAIFSWWLLNQYRT